MAAEHSDTEVFVTEHAFKRAKERLGWNAKTTKRMVSIALDKGIQQNETNGKLNRYLTKLYFTEKKANNLRIYGEHIYLFHEQTLITVFYLPNQFKKVVHPMGKQ